jgi:hypothetical protein
VLDLLSIVGTAAMLWVSGGILIHGLENYHIALPEHAVEGAKEYVMHHVPVLPEALGWLTGATLMGLFGLAVGAVLVAVLSLLPAKSKAH